MYDLQDFLAPVVLSDINGDNSYNDGQFAKNISIFETEIPDITGAGIVLVGVNETRGAGAFDMSVSPPDAIRRQLYQLHYWHKEINIADIGNIKTGATLSDSYAAIKTVLSSLIQMKKTVVLLGGSHDITLAQYFAYADLKQTVEATCIDSNINLRGESPERSENFLMEMLTGEPNLVRHYNHIGFQSYFVHPRMLETMDKLRFDCFRVGMVKDEMEEMEPVLRNTNLLSFDINALKYGDSPASVQSPNGFTGEEACMLTRYAGMSAQLSSMGIYGYLPQQDLHDLTAKQIAQMLWYFIDGKNRALQEAALDDLGHFNEYHCNFTEVDTMFLQSKKTGRWWMQLPNKKFIASSYRDYVQASQNAIPERWLRALERSL
ncbi:MAG: formimidoylglutamase [Bacteroidetes bacterium]|nr:formimidoylglutamase [Bacteroidota bacterium]